MVQWAAIIMCQNRHFAMLANMFNAKLHHTQDQRWPWMACATLGTAAVPTLIIVSNSHYSGEKVTSQLYRLSWAVLRRPKLYRWN